MLTLLGLPPEAVDEPLYQQKIRPAVYQCLTDTATTLCAFGVPVVVSAPFHPAGFSPEDWKTFQSTVEALGAKFVRVHVVAQPHTVLQRIQSRGAPRDAAKLRDWEEYRSQWDTELPNCLAVVLDNSAGLDTLDLNVAKLAKLIRIEQALDRDWCLH